MEVTDEQFHAYARAYAEAHGMTEDAMREKGFWPVLCHCKSPLCFGFQMKTGSLHDGTPVPDSHIGPVPPRNGRDDERVFSEQDLTACRKLYGLEWNEP